ncbi:hypothetical protein EVAR_24106_1 [Eumeta japonica]|uniref:Nucleic-acid-binding protein from transposon X-element n=1 Tax=Eumeta variegata TaxID=151549 RepID=A0A4C1ZX31_EUMVA|nr:hypothetical protein EVAR_24106_1 [Eumeta japonica]
MILKLTFAVRDSRALSAQNHPYISLPHFDTPFLLVLADLPKNDEARSIFKNLNQVCGFSGIRMEAPHKKGGPGQCYRCQQYGYAAANCHTYLRSVKCLVLHWTRECQCIR